MEAQLSLPNFFLTVVPEALPLFTTVFQSGIEIKSRPGISMGRFLNDLPGFNAEYVGNTIQTIFLNGTAIDDLTTPLVGDNPVLALSAAMPGLAGAIFRKNSFYSALRTDTEMTNGHHTHQESLKVTLKLFNSIARERGTELLKMGICIKAEPFSTFLTQNTALIRHINEIRLRQEKINTSTFFSSLLQSDTINIQIVESHG